MPNPNLRYTIFISEEQRVILVQALEEFVSRKDEVKLLREMLEVLPGVEERYPEIVHSFVD